ncbi:hypothetical protein AC628_09380 [Bradyrhizobium sp. NAS96.2]|nr:hypothetical protein AC628_09380 [Bradyrhizobium sp. NAS96.2]
MAVVEQKLRLDGVATAIRLPKQNRITILQAEVMDLIAQISAFIEKYEIVAAAGRVLEACLNTEHGATLPWFCLSLIDQCRGVAHIHGHRHKIRGDR